MARHDVRLFENDTIPVHDDMIPHIYFLRGGGGGGSQINQPLCIIQLS